MNTLKNQSWRAYSLIFMSFLVFSGNKLQSQSIWGSNLASKVELWLKALFSREIYIENLKKHLNTTLTD